MLPRAAKASGTASLGYRLAESDDISSDFPLCRWNRELRLSICSLLSLVSAAFAPLFLPPRQRQRVKRAR